jgi:hypothetical protein
LFCWSFVLKGSFEHREQTKDGQVWVQYVSSTPATRLDVINMQQDLDQRLAERKSKETGICAVREELYGQTFDELIRQVRNISLEHISPWSEVRRLCLFLYLFLRL